MFQSTPFPRRATTPITPRPHDNEFQSTPFPRRATADALLARLSVGVSIHALPAKGDRAAVNLFVILFGFNPRPSREGRHGTGITRYTGLMFQSTPFPRRATRPSRRPSAPSGRFNPRPSREGRRRYAGLDNRCHAFQSTPFPRRATRAQRGVTTRKEVSIHALPAKGDCPRSARKRSVPCFNPRPSREGRPCAACASTDCRKFQSTPFPRRATTAPDQDKIPTVVSIHALPAKGDHVTRHHPAGERCFNPRPSREGRRGRPTARRRKTGFNPRPSREGRQYSISVMPDETMFQSTPFPRRATRTYLRTSFCRCFNPRPSREGRPDRLNELLPQPYVSIHALPAKGDHHPVPVQHGRDSFNPRPSREGRRLSRLCGRLLVRFQSTPFPRRATGKLVEECVIMWGFQSTPFPRRATGFAGSAPSRCCGFNPRPSREGRPG